MVPHKRVVGLDEDRSGTRGSGRALQLRRCIVRKRIARKILKYQGQLRYTRQQIKRAEEKLGVPSPAPAPEKAKEPGEK